MKKFYENPLMIMIAVDAEIDTVALSNSGDGDVVDLENPD